MNMFPFPCVLEFTNLGLDCVNKTAIVKTEKDFWKVVTPHFMSRDIDYEYDPDTNEGKIYFGGFRCGGSFKRVSPDEIAKGAK